MADIYGTSAADALNGTASSDSIFGGEGGDTVFGHAGNDFIYGYGASDAAPDAGAIAVTTVASGLNQTLYLTDTPADPGFLYAVQKSGEILRINAATGASSVFLDIPDSDMRNLGEGGLLGLAFHPQYTANGKFYVTVANMAGDIEVRQYSRGATGIAADVVSKTVLLTIPHPTYTNHYGGWLGFGPDGFLRITTGDGGTPSGADNASQNLASLLGKVLRIDVNSDGFPGDPARNYTVPTTNPFAAGGGAPEIWAYGLRNPWRASFDSLTGDFYIGDVGQSRIEEINFESVAAPGGVNYGWPGLEGNLPFSANPLTGSATLPVYQYDHTFGVSVTGGYVYRGDGAGAQGHYFLADFASGKFVSLKMADGVAIDAVERTGQLVMPAGSLTGIASFGVDQLGRLYAVSFFGSIYRLTPGEGAGDAGDVLAGEEGDDQIFAGAGNDSLLGGTGNDLMAGGFGNDEYYGGAGVDIARIDGRMADHHVFTYRSNGQLITRITDFARLDGDSGLDLIVDIETVQFSNYSLPLHGAQANRISNIAGSRFDDIVFHNSSTGQSHVNVMTDGIITGSSPFSVANGLQWQAKDTADFNADGRADIIYQNISDGSYAIGVTNSSGFVGSYSFITASLSITYRLVGVADLDGDSYTDLLIQNSTNGIVYFGDMTGTAFNGWKAISNEGIVWQARALGDVNGDGRADVIYQNSATGVIVAGLMTEAGSMSAYQQLTGSETLPWRVADGADVNGDGFVDVILQRVSNGDISYVNMANGVASGYGTILTGFGSAWQLEGVADTNNDGDMDAVIRNVSGSGDTYVVNMENGNFAGFALVAQGIGSQWYVV